jgi:hypothetical protein
MTPSTRLASDTGFETGEKCCGQAAIPGAADQVEDFLSGVFKSAACVPIRDA